MCEPHEHQRTTGNWFTVCPDQQCQGRRPTKTTHGPRGRRGITNRAMEVVLVRYVYVSSAGTWLTSPVSVSPIRNSGLRSLDPRDGADASSIPPDQLENRRQGCHPLLCACRRDTVLTCFQSLQSCVGMLISTQNPYTRGYWSVTPDADKAHTRCAGAGFVQVQVQVE